MNEPLLSVIVLGFRHFGKTTQPCIETLLPWAADPRVEIWLIDNGSDDDAGARARAWCEQHPVIKFLPGNQNLGFAGGMNWASSYARGEWLLLVNNDTLFPENTLNALISVLKVAPERLAHRAIVSRLSMRLLLHCHSKKSVAVAGGLRHKLRLRLLRGF